MIGIIAEKTETAAAKEFFQLFKTPWEFYKTDKYYDVVLLTRDTTRKLNSRFIIIYGADKKRLDSEYGIVLGPKTRNVILEYNGIRFPIYKDTSIFETRGEPLVRVDETSQMAGIEIDGPQVKVLRLGYNLFEEIGFLLSSGQPTEYAHIPTLEIHIAILRDSILREGVPLVEIPPIPAGYNFIVSLTHDVDFVGIRKHKFDCTLMGFLYRGLLSYFLKVVKGNGAWNRLWENWKAILSLPLVFSGLAEDFWIQFDRYMEIEKGLGSTYFFIPFKTRAGEHVSGQTPKRRALGYDIGDVQSHVKGLVSRGSEIGLHGIDAWHDVEKAREESNRVSSLIGRSNIGVRMHWLYFNSRSPEVLEKAGFLYDSTLGYNDCIGYWGGTTQVFRPLGRERLLELPLHVQDTALFYPKRMGLAENQAFELCKRLIRNASIYGGVLVINWHHRSLAPERLWKDFYIRLIDKINKRGVWFGNASQIVEWFKKRRQVTFEDLGRNGRKLRIVSGDSESVIQPPMRIRIHRPEMIRSGASGLPQYQKNYTEIAWNGERNIEMSI